jgi:hypothetical protein
LTNSINRQAMREHAFKKGMSYEDTATKIALLYRSLID